MTSLRERRTGGRRGAAGAGRRGQRRPWVALCVALSAVLLVTACGRAADEADDAGAAEPSAAPELDGSDSPSPAQSDGATQSEDAAGEVDPVEVTVSLGSTSFAYGSLLIAQEAGIFERNGLVLDLVTTGTGSDAVTALLGGSVDFAGSGATAAVAANAEGQDLRLIARAYKGTHSSYLVSSEIAESLGVTADSSFEERVLAFDGLTVSFGSATSSTRNCLIDALSEFGGSMEETYIDPAASIAAFSAGAVDAMALSSPGAESAVLDTGAVILISGPEGECEGRGPSMAAGIMVAADYLAENPDLVERFVASMVEGSEFIAEQDEEARTIARELYPDLSEEVFEAAWESNRLAYTEPLLTVADMEQEIESFLLSSGPEASDAIRALDPASLLADDVAAGGG